MFYVKKMREFENTLCVSSHRNILYNLHMVIFLVTFSFIIQSKAFFKDRIQILSAVSLELQKV